MPFYFDESIHDNRGEFILGAFVFGVDPTVDVRNAITAVGLDPDKDEFKSSAKMQNHPEQRLLREKLYQVLKLEYRYGVVVVPRTERRRLGEEALRGLVKICRANRLTNRREDAYFDSGIFQSESHGNELARVTGASQYCAVHPEQDSRLVNGLQLADLVAHACANMLLDALGLLTKKIKAGANSGYPPDMEIALGFHQWAGVRWNFFSGGLPKPIHSNEDMVVEVADYGLHIADSCSQRLREAALARFGRQYLGCIH